MIIFFMLISFSLSCEKDKMPKNDGNSIDKETILGNWDVQKTDAYLTTSISFVLLGFNPEEKLKEKLDDESIGKTLCFEQDSVYSIFNGNLYKSSSYYIKKDTLFLENPYLIGTHYTPYFYIKRNSENTDEMIAYLKKKESLDLIDHDNSITSLEKSTIKQFVNDAQCEIWLQKNDTDYSHLY